MRLKLYRGKWAAVWREGGTTQRRSLRTADRGVAERLIHDLKRHTTGETIASIMDAYIAEKTEHGARSVTSMQASWKALQPHFGPLMPDQISRSLCRDYAKKRRAGGVADGTIIKDLGVLKAAVRWAGKAAGAVFDMPSAPAPRSRYLTREEVERLADACKEMHIRLFVILAWSTAGRASALMDLTWDRVDFGRGLIQLSRSEGRRKGRATVPMTEKARAALKEAHERRTCDYVIEWAGKPLKSVKRAFATACEAAGIEDASPHVLRHSAAVRMAEDDVPMDVIAQYLGHSDPRVTFRVYARYSPSYLRKAAAALE